MFSGVKTQNDSGCWTLVSPLGILAGGDYVGSAHFQYLPLGQTLLFWQSHWTNGFFPLLQQME